MGITDKNLGGRAYLVGKLVERGLSRRQAVRILNTIFQEMGEALQRGEDVEFPYGCLKVNVLLPKVPKTRSRPRLE